MQDTYIVTAPDGTTYEVEAPAGATEDEILGQVKKAHEVEKPNKMSPEDEQSYMALAADPRSTASDIIGFLKQRGFGADPKVVEDFVRMRNKPGAKINSQMSYTLPKAPPRPLNTGRDNIRAAAAKFLDGVLPGSAEAARGVREVVINAARVPFTDEHFDPGKAYKKGEEDIRRVRREFEDKHENIAAGMEAGGTVTGIVALPQAKLFRGGRLAAGVGNGMVNGAGYGFVSGALNDTGEGRVANAVNGTVFGTLFGGAAPVVFRGGAATADAARRNIPGMDRVVSGVESAAARLRGLPNPPPSVAARAQAERLAARAMDDAHIDRGIGTTGTPASPQSVAQEVLRREALGVPTMPADTAEPLRRLTSQALRGRGTMSSRAREVLGARQAEAAARTRQHVQAEFGPVVDPLQAGEEITARARAAAGPAYATAYAEGSPMVIGEDLANLMRRPAFQEALPQAYRNIRNRGGDPEALGFTLGEDGSVMLSRQPTFEAFDQVGRTMNGQLKRNPMTGRPELDNETAGISQVMQDLDDHLRSVNPAFDAAKVSYADEMAIRDALGRGGDVARLSGPAIQQQLRAMPPHAQEAWTIGARSALADVATQQDVMAGGNAAQRLRQAVGLSAAGNHAAPGDAAKLQALETVSGRPGIMGRLDDRLEAEDQAYRTYRAMSGAHQPDPFQTGIPVASAMEVAGKLSTGNLPGAVRSVLTQSVPQGRFGFRGRLMDEVATLMTSTGPEAVAALQRVENRGAADAARRLRLDSRAGRLASLTTAHAAGASTLPDDPYGPLGGFDALGEAPQAPEELEAPSFDPSAPLAETSAIAPVLPDGRVLRGFVQRPDGSFVADYGQDDVQ